MNQDLQSLLAFLNTWYISNQSRQQVDLLDNPVEMRRFTKKYSFTDSQESVIQFRNAIREMVQTQTFTGLNPMLDGHVRYEVINDGARYALEPQMLKNSLIDESIVLLVKLAQDQQLHRLKMCPDCQYVFFDSSKSGTKKWCSMNKQSDSGRACGTISKVRTYRKKNEA